VDPTAIVVAEAECRVEELDGWNLPQRAGLVEPYEITKKRVIHETSYIVRHLERLTLGTPYPKVAQHVALLMQALKRRGIHRPGLYLDATGVGLPVIELVAAALKGQSVRLVSVSFTHGDKFTRGKDTASLGKAFLVSRLQALLQTGRIKLPKTAESEALARELQDYEIKIDADANDKYGAFRVGAHDDLVTALGLAVLEDPLKAAQKRRLVTFT